MGLRVGTPACFSFLARAVSHLAMSWRRLVPIASCINPCAIPPRQVIGSCPPATSL
jgi:hypothetical protein